MQLVVGEGPTEKERKGVREKRRRRNMKATPLQKIQLLEFGQAADALGDGLELVVGEVPVGKRKEKVSERVQIREMKVTPVESE